MANLMKITALFFASYLLALKATPAQDDIDVACRTRAKESAVKVYSSCVAEIRKTKIDEIKRDYKSEVETLKAKYDQMLKEVLPKSSNLSPTPTTKNNPRRVTGPGATVRPNQVGRASGRPERPTPGIPKALPQKQFDNGPALPMMHESSPTASPIIDSGTNEPEMIEVFN